MQARTDGGTPGYPPPMLAFLLACAPASHTAEAFAGQHHGQAQPGDSGDTGSGGDSADSASPCEDDVVACIGSFPFHAEADTREGTKAFNAYSCSPDTDEGGPELLWRLDVPEDGFLSAVVEDDAAGGTDIDLHLLQALDGDKCIERGNFDVGASVEAGSYFLAADSYVSGGQAQAGEFTLDVDFLVPHTGNCDVEKGSIRRVNDGGDALEMPATGPVVMEAHLVAVDDGYGTQSTDDWPQSSTEGLSAHYSRGYAESGLAMHRGQNWAPQESCEYGQGASGDKLPREDETWYVNMYWSNRPNVGTRMILRTSDGRAVVASAGWETGPGELDHVAGTTEETHFYLGTGHLDSMTVGFAKDQSLELGPIVCN